MSDPKREVTSEKRPPMPAPPFTPFLESDPSSVAPGGAVGGAAPQKPGGHFEEIYNNYLRRRQEVWADLQERIAKAYRNYTGALNEVALSSHTRCEEAHRAYARAARGDEAAEETERSAEEVYRDYMKALQEEWGAEEAQQGSAEAYGNYVRRLEEIPDCGEATRRLDEAQHVYEEALRRTWSPEVAPKCCDAYGEYVRELKQAREACRSGCAEAYRQYVNELQRAWQAADVKAVDAPLLSAIGQSLMAVAFYASEGSAACG